MPYKAGEKVVTVEDKVEIGVAGKTGKIVPKGTKLKVLEIRGSWIGVRAEIDGKPHNGWVLGEQIGKPSSLDIRGRFCERRGRTVRPRLSSLHFA